MREAISAFFKKTNEKQAKARGLEVVVATENL
jgi:hypothetical protein